ncbi:hypothetical protein FPV67DRAFT_1095973 [Lyophyllum atratum]|nr:hypothetical protein FPV67DRAFT_1095973 [Lyophyllum atratum]
MSATKPISAFPTAAHTSGVEHAIWSGLVGVLMQPVFQQVVGGIVNTALAQCGLNPDGLMTPYGAQQGLYFPNAFDASSFQYGLSVPHVTPYGAQQGLWSSFTSALQHPLAQQSISGAVNTAFTQHGINPGAAADIQQALLSDIGSTLTSSDVYKTLRSVVDTILIQRGLTPLTLAQYPEVQQGVWSGLVGLLNNPTFKNVVSTVIHGALVQRGVSVSAPSDAQQVLFADFASLLKDPLVQETLASVIDTAVSQRGLDPDTASQHPEIQEGIFTSLTGLLSGPIFKTLIGTVSNTVVAQHGLNPVTVMPGILHGLNSQKASPNPEIQQGIVTGIAGVLRSPTFRTIVGTVLDRVLAQRSDKPSAVKQQGLRTGSESLQGPTAAIADQPDVQQALSSLADVAANFT